MIKKHNVLVAVLLLFAVVSCQKRPVYHDTHEFSNGEWSSGEMPTFSFDIKDSVDLYDLEFVLRVNGDYDYQNIWILMHTMKPSGENSTDTINLQISDPKGKWLGKKSGSTYSYTAVFGRNHQFKPTGKYRIKMEHAVDDPNLRGVLDLSLLVKNSESN